MSEQQQISEKDCQIQSQQQPQQPQQQSQVQIEGIDSVSVRVTNLLNGFFTRVIQRRGSMSEASQRSQSESFCQQQSQSQPQQQQQDDDETTRQSLKLYNEEDPSSSALEIIDPKNTSNLVLNRNISHNHNKRKGNGGKQQIPSSTSSWEQKENSKPKWFEQYMPNFVIQLRAFCGLIVLDDRFQLIMILLILANAITMGIATFDFVYDNAKMQNNFETLDMAFLIVFTIELALEFGYWGYQLFFDGWLLFDLITVVVSWWLDGVQVFRSFRIFRAFRLVNRIPVLKSLVYAVFHVLPRITSIIMLFALVLYIYAVMCTTLYKDMEDMSYNYFGRLDYSLFTLFQLLTFEEWGDVVREIGETHTSAYLIFGTYLVITGFILYSLVVAVVCDSFLLVEARIRKEVEERSKMDRERRRREMKARQKGKQRFLGGGDNSSFTERDGDDNMRDETGMMDMKNSGEERFQSAGGGGACKQTRKGQSLLGQCKNETSATSTSKSNSSFSQPTYGAKDENDDDIDDDDYTDHLPDPLITTLTTSPDTLTTTATTTLAAGALERRQRRHKQQQRQQQYRLSSKQRIARVQGRLNQLANNQNDILRTLSTLCNEVESYSNRLEKVKMDSIDCFQGKEESEEVANETEKDVKDDVARGGIATTNSSGRGVRWSTEQPTPSRDADFTKIRVKMPHND